MRSNLAFPLSRIRSVAMPELALVCGLFAVAMLCNAGARLGLQTRDLGILPLALLVAVPAMCWLVTQSAAKSHQRELFLACAAGAFVAGPVANALLSIAPTAPVAAHLDATLFTRWLYGAAVLGVAIEATKYAMVRFAFATLAAHPRAATGALGLGFGCYAAFAVLSAHPEMSLLDAALRIAVATATHRALAAALGAAMSLGFTAPRALRADALGLVVTIALSGAMYLAATSSWLLIAASVVLIAASLAMTIAVRSDCAAFKPRHAIALLACAAALFVVGANIHAKRTQPSFVSHKEQGLSFDRPAHWLRASSAPEASAGHAVFVDPLDPRQRIEVRVDERPPYPGLGLVLDIEKLARHGSYYRTTDETTVTIAGVPWLRTVYDYVRPSDEAFGLTKVEAIEYALAANGRLWVVTLEGAAASLDTQLSASLRYRGEHP